MIQYGMAQRKQPPKQHNHRRQTTRSSWSWTISQSVPYIFVTIAVLPCFHLIWHSLKLTKSFPNRSYRDVVTRTKSSPLSSPPSFSGTNIADGRSHHDFDTTNEDILTLYLQGRTSNDSISTITTHVFPQFGMKSCLASRNTIVVPKLPVDEYPHIDPFIPWIHDYHINYPAASEVRFIAQNMRRCYTGINMESQMKYWEPQMALFQSVSIREEESIDDERMQYRLSSMDNATYKETRFLCHFHTGSAVSQRGIEYINATTLSSYFFNYEYVAWRKGSNYLPMYKSTGRDVSNFLLSQLLFKCPIPPLIRDILTLQHTKAPRMYLDVIPIRSPPRHTRYPIVTVDMVGPKLYSLMSQDKEWLNVVKTYNVNNTMIVPEIERSGRYANLPLCGFASPITDKEPRTHLSDTNEMDKLYRLVACTWTSTSYNRRGDKTVIDDAPSRLIEWIMFHKLAGIDHIYLYDNTQIGPGGNEKSSLLEICRQFPDYVTYISWPASICNNNRPNHKNPGERSSQYSAEASCRSRFGDFTDWMTFIDTDEYIVPMMQPQQLQEHSTVNGNTDQRNVTTWHDVLRAMEDKGYYILKMPSSRGRPRVNLMEESSDEVNAACANYNSYNNSTNPSVHHHNNENSCLVPRRNETYLRVYKYAQFILLVCIFFLTFHFSHITIQKYFSFG